MVDMFFNVTNFNRVLKKDVIKTSALIPLTNNSIGKYQSIIIIVENVEINFKKCSC